MMRIVVIVAALTVACAASTQLQVKPKFTAEQIAEALPFAPLENPAYVGRASVDLKMVPFRAARDQAYFRAQAELIKSICGSLVRGALLVGQRNSNEVVAGGMLHVRLWMNKDEVDRMWIGFICPR